MLQHGFVNLLAATALPDADTRRDHRRGGPGRVRAERGRAALARSLRGLATRWRAPASCSPRTAAAASTSRWPTSSRTASSRKRRRVPEPGFGIENLPYGVVRRGDGPPRPRRPARRRRDRPARAWRCESVPAGTFDARLAQPVHRAGPRRVDAPRARRSRRRSASGRHEAHATPLARRSRLAAPDRGRRLRRLLRVDRARLEPRPHVPARQRPADAQLAAPAGRLPRPRRHGRRQRHADPPPARPAPARRAGRRADVRPGAAARHRARARLRHRRRPAARHADRGVRRARPHLRLRARQRLERARDPALGVPAARPVPRQVVRDVDLALGRAARRARAVPRRRPGAGPAAARLPARGRALVARPRARGRAQRHRRQPHERAQPVLERRADARPRDGQRRDRSGRRPVRVGHDLGPRPGHLRQPDRAVLGRPRRRSRPRAASARSSRTATRWSCAAAASVRTGASRCPSARCREPSSPSATRSARQRPAH